VNVGSAADEILVAGNEVLLLCSEHNDVSSETVQELASRCIDPPHRI
jgi:hypothetical protein